MADPFRIDPLKLCRSIGRSGMHGHLGRIQRHSRHPKRMKGHGHQSHRNLLAGYQEHIHLPLRRIRIDLMSLCNQTVRGLSHSG